MGTKNIKVMGEGSSSGGDYEKISITGNGKVLGDVTAKKARVIGDCRFQGNAAFDLLHLTGKGKIEGDLISQELKVTGDLTVRQNLKGNSLQMRGFVTAGGNVDFESMDIKGGFHVEGFLNVGELVINLQLATSRAREIGGERIAIKSRSLFNSARTLEAELIEGDQIYLEYTTAKIVRGNNIEIGPGCNIELVEYRTSFKCKHRDQQNIEQIKQLN